MRKPKGTLNSTAAKAAGWVALALLAVYIFWGGTYLGIKIAIETMPPFLMAGIRFSLAGWTLYLIGRAKGERRPTLQEWRGAAVVGALLLLGGNGVVSWAEQKVPSYIASLLIATVPLWIAVFGAFNGKKPGAGAWVGIALGLAGIGVLVWNPNDGARTLDVLGIVAILLAAISWSVGSLYSRQARLPGSPLLSTGAQMISGGVLLILAALVLGEFQRFNPLQISSRSLIALGYLVVFGSIVAFTAYIWLMKNAEPTLAATYAFVNPVVAVFLGWLIAHEPLRPNTLAAAALIVAAVVVITVFREKPAPKLEPPLPQPAELAGELRQP